MKIAHLIPCFIILASCGGAEMTSHSCKISSGIYRITMILGSSGRFCDIPEALLPTDGERALAWKVNPSFICNENASRKYRIVSHIARLDKDCTMIISDYIYIIMDDVFFVLRNVNIDCAQSACQFSILFHAQRMLP